MQCALAQFDDLFFPRIAEVHRPSKTAQTHVCTSHHIHNRPREHILKRRKKRLSDDDVPPASRMSHTLRGPSVKGMKIARPPDKAHVKITDADAQVWLLQSKFFDSFSPEPLFD